MNNFKLTKNSIRWVVALKEEAQVILDHYKLEPVNEKTIYPIYKNKEETHWLILCGIGRNNAAASTTYLYAYSSASKYTSWINIGIAGSGKGNYGDICLVDKISTYQRKKAHIHQHCQRQLYQRCIYLRLIFLYQIIQLMN